MFELFGITFYWYGFLIGIGIWVAMEIALARRGEIAKRVFEKAMAWAVVSGVIGARIYHVVDYWGRYYSLNWSRVFYFWDGGLGIWGALVGGVLGVMIFSYFNKLKILKLFDSLIVGVPLAQAVGRVGNYINRELYGKNGEPLFAYEAVLNLVLFGLIWKWSQKKRIPGLIFGVYLIGYGVIRAVLENFRPEESIWKFSGVPVAVIFSFCAVSVGAYFVFRKRPT